MTSNASPHRPFAPPAALLHDVLDKKYVPAGTDARAHFAPFFAAHADVLGEERAGLVLRVVEHVSWTTEKRQMVRGRKGRIAHRRSMHARKQRVMFVALPLPSPSCAVPMDPMVMSRSARDRK